MLLNLVISYPPRNERRINNILPKGVYQHTYVATEKHRRHLSISAKKWWSVPENKQRMQLAQTGVKRSPWSEESRKKVSEGLKRYYRNKKRGEQSK
jgi:hypothetical protein